jgi:hypothetical protein
LGFCDTDEWNSALFFSNVARIKKGNLREAKSKN